MVPAVIGAFGIFPLVALVVRRGVDVPFSDEWEWADLVYSEHTHTLTLARLWQPHNEHRIFIPNLLLATVDRLGGWDPVRMQLLSLVFLALTQLVIWLLIRRTVPRGRAAICFLSATALMLGLAQHENLDWGFQIAWFMCNLGLVAAVWQLTEPRKSAWPFRWAIVAGVLASLCSSQGLLVWPVGLLVIALAGRARITRGTVWLLAGFVTTAVVRAGSFISGAVGHEGFAGVRGFLDYLVVYLGSPIAMSWSYPRSRQAGIVVIVALAALAVVALRSGRRRRVRLAPWLALGIYAVMSALVTAASRAGLGLEQANTSRYSSISQFAWVAVVAGACIAIPRGNARRFASAAAVAACVLLFSLVQSVAGDVLWRAHARQLGVGRAAIASGDVAGLRLLYRSPRDAALALGELARVRDGVFYGASP